MLPERLRRALARTSRVPRAYQDIFTSAAGEMVLQDLAREAGALQVATVAGDPVMSAFNDGKRSLFLHIVGKLRWTEQQMLALAKQAADQPVADAQGVDEDVA